MTNLVETLAKMRKQTLFLVEEGRAIQNHYRRMEREYSNWETELHKLDLAIAELSKEVGISEDDIKQKLSVSEPATNSGLDLLDDILGASEPEPTQNTKPAPDLLDDLLSL